MKSLRITSWVLIVFSLIFKLMHYPFAGPLIVSGAFLLFIHAVIFLIKNVQQNLPDVFFHLNISIWTIYFMFRYMYWSFAQNIFMLAIIALFVYIVIIVINKSHILFRHIILFSYCISLIVLSYIPSHHIYYFFNLNTVLNEKNNTTNYQSWDKYSWFLYGAKKKQEALDANQTAQQAVKESLLKNPFDAEAPEFANYIMQHQQNIAQNNWTNYTRP